MRRVVVLLLLLGLALAQNVADAQTATDTPTPTSTPTAPPTPELSVKWTLAPAEGTGTPQPGQDVVMTYVITGDQMVSAILTFALIVVLWAGFVIARLRRWF